MQRRVRGIPRHQIDVATLVQQELCGESVTTFDGIDQQGAALYVINWNTNDVDGLLIDKFTYI